MIIPIVILAAVVVIAGVFVFLTMRNRLKTESDGFDDEIVKSLTLPVRSSFDVARDKANQQNEQQFDDIENILEGLYGDRYVSGSDEKYFIDRFTSLFNEAYSLDHGVGSTDHLSRQII